MQATCIAFAPACGVRRDPTAARNRGVCIEWVEFDFTEIETNEMLFKDN
jgi:hypothetical protein